MSPELVPEDAVGCGISRRYVLLWCFVIKVTNEEVIHEKQPCPYLQFGPKLKVRGRGSRQTILLLGLSSGARSFLIFFFVSFARFQRCFPFVCTFNAPIVIK